MPVHRRDGLNIHYDISGSAAAPVLTLGHAQAFDRRMWQPQVQALSGEYRVLSLDFRGHGKSDVGDLYSIEDLAADVAGVLDDLGVERTDYVGTSLGGMVGFALALEHADRLDSLTLVATQGVLPQTGAERIRATALAAAAEGGTLAPRIDDLLGRYMPPGYASDHPDDFDILRTIGGANSAEGFRLSSEAIITMSFDNRLADLRLPILVVAGELDRATPPERMRLYCDEIAGAEMVVIPGAAHFPNWDSPEAFNACLRRFLNAR